MKKAIIIAALAFVSFANAQKGSVLVAGNIGFKSENTGDEKANYFEFAPKVGYQFSDNMTVGLETAVTTEKFVNKDTQNTFKLGAFLRYSQPLAGVFSIFGDFGVGMKSSKYKDHLVSGATLETKADGFYIGVVPAIGVDLKKGFCLNFSIGGLGYDSMKPDYNGADATNTFAFTFGKQASVGISKNF
jgi:hypothetical protein